MKKIYFEEFNKAAGVNSFYTPKELGSWSVNEEDGEALFRELAADLGLAPERLLRTKQTHTSAVKVVDATNGGEGAIKPFADGSHDGIITNTKNLLLCTVEADCVPVFLVDPVKEVIGNVHSGWRGTVGQISGNAIKLMQEEFASQPKDIIVGIGPCICGDCYEVSEELLGPFSEQYSAKELEQLFLPKANGKYLLNLKKAIKLTLLRAGVPEANIYDSGYCTYHQEIFDSFRKNGGKKLRILSGIMMKA